MLKALIILAAATTGTSTGNTTPFITYNPPNQSDNIVEATIDKGLIVEIIIKCGRKPNGQISAGIMTYSKFEKLYCSSKLNCSSSAQAAAQETCGW